MEANRENNVHQFRIPVLFPYIIILLTGQVVQHLLAAETMVHGTHVEDPGRRRALEKIEKTISQVEMAEVVDGQCHFDAELTHAPLLDHRARIVDQDIDVLVFPLSR